MRFSDVWLWNEWPEREGPDTGIDLVAKEKDGGLCAIQCKLYQKDHTLQRGDIDSFLAASGKAPFSHRLFVATTDQWGKHAEDVLNNQKPPCERIGYATLTDCLDQARLTHDLERYIDKADLRLSAPKKQIRPHQKEALTDVLKGFQKHKRGQMIMACGTGKTYTALKIAEELTKTKSNATVLFVVPSLSLLSQSMREWALEKSMEHIHFAVCSDSKVGKDNEDIRLVDLGWPATTDPKTLYKKLSVETIQESRQRNGKPKLRVVFSTYQSLDVISQAQKLGARGLAPFDLIVCDEAHRTTGIEQSGETSFFAKVHNKAFIQAHKRLYMTATPRIYGEGAKGKAKEKNIDVISMDDSEIYGPEFHRLDFSKAVEQHLLSDYKVLVLTVSKSFAAKSLNELPEAETKGILNVPEAGLMLGCYNALRYPDDLESKTPPLQRAVAFTTTIKGSKQVVQDFPKLIKNAIEETYSKDGSRIIDCKTQHVDGSFNALERNKLLQWLKKESANGKDGVQECRILSNARCLSEGVDVPALDAVIFLNPRRSKVDIVQAVGRVMRKAEGKHYGYVILPLVVEPGTDPEKALDNDRAYKPIWDVLQALRSHDNRFDYEINKMQLNEHKPDRIRLIGVDEEGRIIQERKAKEAMDDRDKQMDINFADLANAFYAKLVVKCGDRQYWEQWAKDVAKIASAIEARILALLAKTEKGGDFGAKFADFLKSLQAIINPSISQDEAVEMLSQHIITQPVFDALFEGYTFSQYNPVSQAMQKVVGYLEEEGFQSETKDLQAFYESVRRRASGIDNLAGRQQVVIELYEKFFANAFPKVSERLGIVYTPIELVDFVLRSADEVLQKEFAQNLGSEGVRILDPFTGTGSFLVRLLQNKELLPDADLTRKYKTELHANEIMLLAYYIAAVNIENAYHQRLREAGESQTAPQPAARSKQSPHLVGDPSQADQTDPLGPMNRRLDERQEPDYVPFSGIVLTDTFQLTEDKDKQNKMTDFFPINSQRVLDQQKIPIRVILGNPPWSAGQKSENDANKNLKYDALDTRLKETYVEHSFTTNKNTLYDSYVRAIRYASDRIGAEGVIAYVTNGSFLDGNSMDGLRKSLEDEFDCIYCFNLRGNARTVGEQNRKEGGQIFGGSRASVAITFLIKNPKRHKEGLKPPAQIHYHDIGDYLSREDKLKKVRDNSLGSLPWQSLMPNQHHDWINQRDESFQEYLPMGTEESKKLALNKLKDKTKGNEGLFFNSPITKKEKRKDTEDIGIGEASLSPIGATSKQAPLPSLFGVYSSGVKTNRDAWVYNFSQSQLAKNMRSMIGFYNEQLAGYKKALNKVSKLKVDEFVDNEPTKIAWDEGLKTDLERKKEGKYSKARIRPALYRPFCRQWFYFDSQFNSRQYRIPRFFPQPHSPNRLICISGKGANQFSTLMVDTTPDLEVVSKSQCFALYVYDEKGQRHDNIPDETLWHFQSHYQREKAGPAITKEDVFYYAYAVLHWHTYRQAYGADLVKMLARIPCKTYKLRKLCT